MVGQSRPLHLTCYLHHNHFKNARVYLFHQRASGWSVADRTIRRSHGIEARISAVLHDRRVVREQWIGNSMDLRAGVESAAICQDSLDQA
jgi:hypothetical protein